MSGNISAGVMFNFNGRLLVRVDIFYQICAAIYAGVPITTWVKNFLAGKGTATDWVHSNEELAARYIKLSLIATLPVQTALSNLYCYANHPGIS